MFKKNSIIILLLEIAIALYYGSVRIENASHIRYAREFGDTQDYLHNASLSVLDPTFWVDARPPVTALFWKAVNSDPDSIHTLQLYFSILCWVVFAFALSATITGLLLKPLAFALAVMFSLSRDIFMWDAFLGSESIGLSFLTLFLATALWTMQEWKPYKFATLTITALLLALTRDTYAYLLIMVALINIPVFWMGKYRNVAVAVSFMLITVFAISTNLAKTGLRPYRAVLMNVALRVYPKEEYTNYFRKHGMPVEERLVNQARGLVNPTHPLASGEKFTVYLELESGKDQETFRQWAMTRGNTEYIKFLWFFKEETLQSVFTETAGPSFSPDVYYYTATGYRPIIKSKRLTEILYPARFGLLLFFAANLIAACLAAIAWYEKKSDWYISLLMVLFSYPQAVLVWAADVNDVARHSIYYNVLLRLGMWMLFFYITDWMILKIFKRSQLPSDG